MSCVVGEVSCERRKTGSQSFAGSALFKMAWDALVITTPIALKAIIVVGRPRV